MLLVGATGALAAAITALVAERCERAERAKLECAVEQLFADLDDEPVGQAKDCPAGAGRVRSLLKWGGDGWTEDRATGELRARSHGLQPAAFGRGECVATGRPRCDGNRERNEAKRRRKRAARRWLAGCGR
jgi:hypothetical protein